MKLPIKIFFTVMCAVIALLELAGALIAINGNDEWKGVAFGFFAACWATAAAISFEKVKEEIHFERTYRSETKRKSRAEDRGSKGG